MDPYQKRRQKGWNFDKSQKDRGHSKVAIKEELKASDEAYRVKGKKRKRNLKKSMEYSIQWYERVIANRTRDLKGKTDAYLSSLKARVKELKAEYAELKDAKGKSK